jgi:uroporphyrinogen decarboxylase
MNDQKTTKPLLSALRGKIQRVPPIWLMRQAGRYLPEYREIRQRAGGFLDLVYTPDLAAEVTLQPVRRFGMDGAILFSDILVIPHALGQKVDFIEEKGPILFPLRCSDDLKKLSRERFQEMLTPIYETLRLTRGALDREGFDQTTLIGFSGAPWTLACYMVEGGTSRDFIAVKSWAYSDPEGFGDLIDILVDAVTDYLIAQIDAGAEVIQLFESWAGIIDHTLFSRWVIQPTRRIIESLKDYAPHIPVIGFPRQCGRMALDYVQNTRITALSMDSQLSPKQAAGIFQTLIPVQGNLDPVCLLTGGLAMEAAVEDILVHLSGGPFIFNLGHGVIKETPPQHVADLVALVRSHKQEI